MSTNFRDFYCDPLKNHTRRIYSYLRVVPAAMITEHPSLCIRSRDLASCNCLCKLNPEIAFVDTHGASSLSQAVLPSQACSHGGSRSAYVVRVPACEASGALPQTPRGELTSPLPTFRNGPEANSPPPPPPPFVSGNPPRPPPTS